MPVHGNHFDASRVYGAGFEGDVIHLRGKSNSLAFQILILSTSSSEI